jgi:hypothetical protein
MDLSKKTENYTTHETVNSPPSNSLNVNDYFQGFTTLAFMRLPCPAGLPTGLVAVDPTRAPMCAGFILTVAATSSI